MTTKFTVTCADNRVISATKYQAAKPLNKPTTKQTKKQLIIINSALGVRQPFYKPLAQFLAEQGYIVVTWDPRSIGDSKTMSANRDPAKLRDFAMIDLDAMLNHIIEAKWANWSDITLLGHSAGGHLIGLCPSISKLNKVIFISAGTCDWRLYPVSQWPKMWFAWYLLFPVFINLLGYVPSKLAIGHDLSKGVASDWRNWSLKKNYLFADKALTNTYYHQYKGHIHAIGFSDDIGFSPKKTMDDLLTRFPKATTNALIYHPKELNLKKIGHFGFFKRGNQSVWEKLLLAALP